MSRSPSDPAFFALLAGSYRRLTGAALTDRDAAWLYAEAPFVVLAHDTAPDPLFVYANRAAQSCFGYSWDELIGLPSRVSAEAPERTERQRLLDRVSRDGFIADYAGIRIAKSGRRFRIAGATVWNLIDDEAVVRGQAATFSRWTDI